MKKRKIFKKTNKKPTVRKMYLYVIIVNFGLSQNIVDLLQDYDSNLQVAVAGNGTASKEILNIIGLEDTKKDVVLAFVDQTNINQLQKQLNDLFLKSKKFMGMGFAIKMTSIVGQKIYHYLTNTI